jgi:hypothetical protein
MLIRQLKYSPFVSTCIFQFAVPDTMEVVVTSNVDDVNQELCVSVTLDTVHTGVRRTGQALDVMVHLMLELIDIQNTKRGGKKKNSDRMCMSY